MTVQPHLRDDGPRARAGAILQPYLERSLGVLAAALLLILVGVTCVDVFGRYFLNAPLNGAFEMTEVLLVALVFAALPLTTERREHVEVDLLAFAFGPRMNRALIAFGGLFSAAVFFTFAWRLWIHSAKAASDGAVTNALSIPLAPFGYAAALACFVSALIAILRAFILPVEKSPTPNMEKGTS